PNEPHFASRLENRIVYHLNLCTMIVPARTASLPPRRPSDRSPKVVIHTAPRHTVALFCQAVSYHRKTVHPPEAPHGTTRPADRRGSDTEHADLGRIRAALPRFRACAGSSAGRRAEGVDVRAARVRRLSRPERLDGRLSLRRVSLLAGGGAVDAHRRPSGRTRRQPEFRRAVQLPLALRRRGRLLGLQRLPGGPHARVSATRRLPDGRRLSRRVRVADFHGRHAENLSRPADRQRPGRRRDLLDTLRDRRALQVPGPNYMWS